MRLRMGMDTVGAVDMYDFEPRPTGVAVHIDPGHRRQGTPSTCSCALCRSTPRTPATVCEFLRPTVPLSLFGLAQFQETGRRTAWIRSAKGDWEDVLTLQRFFNPTGA